MTSTLSFRRIAIGLMLLSIISGVSTTYATLENGYKLDSSFLTDTSESTRTENGYKTSIIINPDVTGFYAEENGYKLDLAICREGIGGALEENGYRLDLMPEKLFPDLPDIAITGVVASPALMKKGCSALVNVTVANKALDFETFQVIVSVNATTICTQNVTVTGGSSTTIAVTWDTTGFAPGSYTISAYTSPVSGEICVTDNTFVGGTAQIFLPGSGGFGGRTDYCYSCSYVV